MPYTPPNIPDRHGKYPSDMNDEEERERQRQREEDAIERAEHLAQRKQDGED